MNQILKLDLPAEVTGSQVTRKTRLDYLDITRGIVILLVVLYHSPFVHGSYIAWFRMPTFFILSGLLYKQPEKKFLINFIKKRTSNLLIPYFSYGFILTILLTINNFHKPFLAPRSVTEFTELLVLFIEDVFKNFSLLFYGGDRIPGGPIKVLWFINCLYLSTLFFTAIKTLTNSKLLIVVMISILYLAGIYISKTIKYPLPWGINVVFVALPFFSLGYYSKDMLKHINNNFNSFLPVLFALIIICTSLILLKNLDLFDFGFSFRGSFFPNPILMLIVPPLYSLVLLMMAMILSRTSLNPYLSYLGQNTLPILFMHMAVGMFVKMGYNHFGYGPHFLIWVIISLGIPLIAASFFNRNKITQMLFMGKNSEELPRIIKHLFVTPKQQTSSF